MPVKPINSCVNELINDRCLQNNSNTTSTLTLTEKSDCLNNNSFEATSSVPLGRSFAYAIGISAESQKEDVSKWFERGFYN